MSDLNLLLCVILGMLVCPILKTIWFLFRVTRVAVHDTVWVARNSKLKDGYGWWHWLHVLLKTFAKSWGETAVDLWNGVERVL